MIRFGKFVLGVTAAAAVVGVLMVIGPCVEALLGPALLSDGVAEILEEVPHFYD